MISFREEDKRSHSRYWSINGSYWSWKDVLLVSFIEVFGLAFVYFCAWWTMAGG